MSEHKPKMVTLQGCRFDLNLPSVKNIKKDDFLRVYGKKRHTLVKGEKKELPSLMADAEKGWKALQLHLKK